MDNGDRLLIARLLKGIPIVREPFQRLAQDLDLEVSEILLRLGRLKREGEIGFWGAVLDHEGAGLKHFLVALEVDKSEEDDATEALRQHPGVLSCSRHSHELNIWFEIGLAGHESFTDHARRIGRLTNARRVVALPRLGASNKFDCSKEDEVGRKERRILEALSEDFPVTDKPFQGIAEALHMEEGELLSSTNDWIEKRKICRIGVEMKDASPLGKAGDWVGWEVPEERVVSFIEKVRSEGVKSIYVNAARSAGFLFSVLTLIDSQEGSLEEKLEQISKAGQGWPKEVFSLRRNDFNRRVRYFSSAFEVWKGRSSESGSDVLQMIEGIPECV